VIADREQCLAEIALLKRKISELLTVIAVAESDGTPPSTVAWRKACLASHKTDLARAARYGIKKGWL